MSAFGTLDTAASGAILGKTWLDAVAHNIANVNTVRPADEEPFRAKLVVARERSDGQGVTVAGIEDSAAAPQIVYDPDHPMADTEGRVVRPVVDLAGEMANMMAAQRSYQANLSVIRSSREAYEAAMRLGR
jgi:flagellar basal-body rod protein FlgC